MLKVLLEPRQDSKHWTLSLTMSVEQRGKAELANSLHISCVPEVRIPPFVSWYKQARLCVMQRLLKILQYSSIKSVEEVSQLV